MGPRTGCPRGVVMDRPFPEFDAFEIAVIVGQCDDVMPAMSRAEYDALIAHGARGMGVTVYGHQTGKGVSALADCPTVGRAQTIAAALADDRPVYDYSFPVEG
jgi:hypothetical protein